MPMTLPRPPSFFQITASVLLGLVMAWTIGFFIFFGIVATQTPETPETQTDLAVVLTGASGRIEAGFQLLADGHTKALLISGVHPDVTLKQLVELWPATPQAKAAILHHCCITIGHMAESTDTNARETVQWLEAHPHIDSIRIVTSNYHMPRAWLLFRRQLPDKTLTVWPVTSNGATTSAFWRNILIEYSKTLMTWAS